LLNILSIGAEDGIIELYLRNPINIWVLVQKEFFFELQRDIACKFALFKVFVSEPVLLKPILNDIFKYL